jgi:NitT/TauT family transport system permease protein
MESRKATSESERLGSRSALADREHQSTIKVGQEPILESQSILTGLRSSPSRWLAPVSFFIFVTGVWEWLSQTERVSRFVLPAPSGIARATVDLAQEGFFWEAFQITLSETVIGFILGAGVGFILGILIGEINAIKMAIYPYVILFQSLPKVALAPIFVIWFGFGLASKVIMAATIAFFPVLVNTLTGLEGVNKNAQLLFRGYGASRSLLFRKLSLPEILAAVMAGLKTAITLALIGAIVAEFVGAQKGLGILLERFNFQLQMEEAFAVLLYLALMGLVLYLALDVIDRKVIFWKGHSVE